MLVVNIANVIVAPNVVIMVRLLAWLSVEYLIITGTEWTLNINAATEVTLMLKAHFHSNLVHLTLPRLLYLNITVNHNQNQDTSNHSKTHLLLIVHI